MTNNLQKEPELLGRRLLRRNGAINFIIHKITPARYSNKKRLNNTRRGPILSSLFLLYFRYQ